MRPSIAWVGLLALCVVVATAPRGDARPEKIRAGHSYYSDDHVEEGLVRDIAEEKNYEEVYQFYGYYEAIYDDAGRVVTFREYQRGDPVRTEQYRYAPDGTLLERIVKRPGRPDEITRPAAE